MLTLRRGGREYVRRRGPAHLRGSSNAALAREVEVLRVLRGTGVPHARLVAACLDPEVLDGAVF
ncbi:MAG: hypothetical protein QOF76_4457 [Solirubrobacteraceae bacterium]|jgi:aminoglycoside phosphotransferase (APT) family kinase protein|nr:hypothetical protein [Solirubrobacteraceae bacterium]